MLWESAVRERDREREGGIERARESDRIDRHSEGEREERKRDRERGREWERKRE